MNKVEAAKLDYEQALAESGLTWEQVKTRFKQLAEICAFGYPDEIHIEKINAVLKIINLKRTYLALKNNTVFSAQIYQSPKHMLYEVQEFFRLGDE